MLTYENRYMNTFTDELTLRAICEAVSVASWLIEREASVRGLSRFCITPQLSQTKREDLMSGKSVGGYGTELRKYTPETIQFSMG